MIDLLNRPRPPRFFNLDAEPLPDQDPLAWSHYMEALAALDQHSIAQERVRRFADWRVSTVFLGLDPQYGGGGPVGPAMIFESMVFGGPLDLESYRSATRAQAHRGHAELLARARAVPLLRELLWIVEDSVRQAMAEHPDDVFAELQRWAAQRPRL